MLRSLMVEVYRSTRLQMARRIGSQTALPSCAADTIDADDPARKTHGLPHLYPLQRGGEAAFAVAHRWAHHFGCSS